MAKIIIKKNIPLAPFTTFGIGGPAEFFCQVKNTTELLQALLWAKKRKKNYFILGGGSNILIADKGIKGLVIRMENRELQIDGEIVKCDSGILATDLVARTINKGLSGLEYFIGLPGTVGGAIYKNSHWHNHFFSDFLVEAQVLNKDLKLKKVPKAKMKFSYDWSSFQGKNYIITKLIFKLHKEQTKILKKIAKEILTKRLNNQPKGKSAGCIFKNPQGKSAGFLIDQVGLKGKRVGDIEISKKHANFFINIGNGTASDVINLLKKVQKKVKDKFGIMLESEIFLQGDFDEEVNY